MIYPFHPMIFPYLPTDYNIPPTIKSLLDSYVNFGKPKENKIKIPDLPKAGRSLFFDFNYPLDSSINREEFEIIILKHYLMRRIGYETVSAFKIALEVKLNEIMPTYNKLYNAYNTWNIFEDGELTDRTLTDSQTGITNNTTTSSGTNTSTGSNNTLSDRRYSDTPQDNLTDIQNGSYISEYNLDNNTNTSNINNTSSDNSTSNSNNSNDENLHEIIKKTPADKMKNYTEFLEARQHILSMIFKDLDVLFYQVI